MKAGKSLAFGLFSALVTSIQSVSAQAPAPLDLKVDVAEYYPTAGLALEQMARLIVQFRTSQSGYGVKPFSAALVSAELVPYKADVKPGDDVVRESFATGAEILIRLVRFKEPVTPGVDKRLSILYLLSPCNQLTHDASADYAITICREHFVPGPDVTTF